jgi:hypothetical protein
LNGTNLIANSPPDQPVIIITINYRLGVLADMYLTLKHSPGVRPDPSKINFNAVYTRNEFGRCLARYALPMFSRVR